MYAQSQNIIYSYILRKVRADVTPLAPLIRGGMKGPYQGGMWWYPYQGGDWVGAPLSGGDEGNLSGEVDTP